MGVVHALRVRLTVPLSRCVAGPVSQANSEFRKPSISSARRVSFIGETVAGCILPGGFSRSTRMPEDDARANQLDTPAADQPGENQRNGEEKRGNPNEPAAVVGLGASAGGVAPLQQFFADMNPESGLGFVVVMHLSPEHESQLPSVLQQKTKMPVTQVTESVKVRPNHVYVIPPNHQLTFADSTLCLLPRNNPAGG